MRAVGKSQWGLGDRLSLFAVAIEVQGAHGCQPILDAQRNIRLVGVEHQLAGDAGRQAGGVADHPAGIACLPGSFDHLRVKEQACISSFRLPAGRAG